VYFETEGVNTVEGHPRLILAPIECVYTTSYITDQ